MPVPPGEQVDHIRDYSVVQLFLERAQRVCSDFSLADEQAGVVHVCRLVEGLPLAIELAASWTNVLRCEVIATEIERGLQFLHTDLRNISDRHRSMQAVFEHSWMLLSPDERSAFARLAVFRGGFQREAAEQIAGATLPILAALVRKSLLHRESDGRYQIHELLRQYVEERLAQASSEELVRTGDRHCAYYLTFLRDHDAAMSGARQVPATAELAAELGNLRAAWLWAVERRNIAAMVGAANAFYLFCQFRSRYLEGAQLWERAVHGLSDEMLAMHPDAALLLYELGWFYVRLGRLERARELFERSHDLYRHFGRLPSYGHSSDPRLGLGLLASLRGDYAEAQRLLEQARQTSEQDGYLGNQRNADYFLAGIYLAQGHNRAAQQHAEAAYAVAQAAQDRWFMAYCLNELGMRPVPWASTSEPSAITMPATRCARNSAIQRGWPLPWLN
jgi:tetratricopeptide (TPR) repeat protein